MEKYIQKTINNNQLKLVSGKRNWRKYFIIISELHWARNLRDGFEVHVYSEEYGDHLATVIV